jgi:pimeloyl-ACP methyl ester carboxylesterase
MKLKVVLCLLATASAKPLNWEVYKVQDGDASNFIVTAATFKAHRGHNLRVVRYIRGHPTSHIILLPPAPGQGAKYWEGELAMLTKMYEKDFVLYAPDLRGTGEFPFMSNKETSWMHSGVDKDLKSDDGLLDLDDLTIAGLAYDVTSIVDRIKDDATFQGKLVIHSRGFGSLVAIEALERDDKMFESVILESHLPLGAWTNVQNDSSFLDLCARDDFCKSQFGGMDPKQIRTVLVSLGSPNYNSCAAVMIEEIKKMESFSKLASDASDWMRLQEFLTPFMYGRVKLGSYNSADIVLPFLSNAYLCPDVEKFKKEVLPDMIRLAQETGVNKFEHFGRNADVNNFVNAWFMMQEIFQMGSPKQHVCQTPTPLGMANPCVIYQYYYRFYKAMKNRLQNRSSKCLEIKAPETNLYFVGGGQDLLTPLLTTEDLYTKSEAKSKRLFKLSLQGHNPLGEGVCARQIGAEILGQGTKEETFACIEKVSFQKLNWLLPGLKTPPAGTWWTMAVDGEPKRPVQNGAGFTAWYIGAMVVGILAVITVTGHVIWILTRSKKVDLDS